MTISSVLKTITSNRASYLANLNAAFELSEQAELDDDHKKRLIGLMDTLKQDTISPTLLLPEQKATLDQVVEKYDLVVSPVHGVQSGLTVEGQFLVLHNITCTDANGQVFEQYDKLYVAKDIVRSDGKMATFTPYQAIQHLEEHSDMFVPSFALSCNLLAALYAHKDNPETNLVLQQYKDHGAGYGWHAQNTVVDWKGKRLVHYPSRADFPEHGWLNVINKNKSAKVFPFTLASFTNKLLEEALTLPSQKTFTQNLTGLKDPSVLVEIGNYFGKPAKEWVSNNPQNADYTTAAWLGCNSDYFDLDADVRLSDVDAVRGVRQSAP